MEGWVDLGYPAMHRPGIELAISRSLVRRPTTTLPSNPSNVAIMKDAVGDVSVGSKQNAVQVRRASLVSDARWFDRAPRRPSDRSRSRRRRRRRFRHSGRHASAVQAAVRSATLQPGTDGRRRQGVVVAAADRTPAAWHRRRPGVHVPPAARRCLHRTDDAGRRIPVLLRRHPLRLT